MSAVEVRSVSKSLGGNKVLRNVDLMVSEAEVVCLMGPSGSGKSTLLRCINGLILPDRGHVFVGNELIGRRAWDGKLHELTRTQAAIQRRQIGMVFQQFNLFPHLTVKQNMLLAPRLAGMRKADLDRRTLELLELVGLADKIDSFPRHLSGGQQQRVAIARALMMEPRLMLFDEPTSALDPELVGEVLRAMQRLAAAGMTMIVVTHEVEFAREVADRVIFIADGQVEEIATAGEFFSAPKSLRAQRFLRSL